MARAPKAELLDINSATADQLGTRCPASAGLFRKDHRGTSYKGKDDLVNKGHRPQKTYTAIKDKIIAKQKS